MSKIGNLKSSPKTVTIGGEELTLIPLNVEDIDLIANMIDAKKEDQIKTAKALMKGVLKKSYPDMEDKEFEDMSVDNFTELTKVICEMHGMKIDEDKLKKLAAGKVSG